MRFFIKTLFATGAIVLFLGCASSQPQSRVGIVNGRYAVQTKVPNNNKGKKVNLIRGQSYNCEVTNDSGNTYSFDLKANRDNTLLNYNDKLNGKPTGNSYTARFVYDPKLIGFVETTQGDHVIHLTNNNSGKIVVYSSKKDAVARKQRAIVMQCTQTTNNTYTHTRYLTDHEISEYQHSQASAKSQQNINRNFATDNWYTKSANTNTGSYDINELSQNTFNPNTKKSSTYLINSSGNLYNVQKLGDDNIQF